LAIQPYSGFDLEKTEKKIQELYNSRGKSAHATIDDDIQEQLDFLKSIFRIYVYKKYGFVKLKMH